MEDHKQPEGNYTQDQNGDQNKKDHDSDVVEYKSKWHYIWKEWILGVAVYGLVLFVIFSAVIYAIDSSRYCYNGKETLPVTELAEGNYTCLVCDFTDEINTTLIEQNCFDNTYSGTGYTIQSPKTQAHYKVEGRFGIDKLMYTVGKIVTFEYFKVQK